MEVEYSLPRLGIAEATTVEVRGGRALKCPSYHQEGKPTNRAATTEQESATGRSARVNVPNVGHRYFVAQVAQISGGNAQANAVNSTDLVWSRLVRDQEVDGSNPFAPTTSFRANNLHQRKVPTTSWLCAKRS